MYILSLGVHVCNDNLFTSHRREATLLHCHHKGRRQSESKHTTTQSTSFPNPPKKNALSLFIVLTLSESGRQTCLWWSINLLRLSVLSLQRSCCRPPSGIMAPPPSLPTTTAPHCRQHHPSFVKLQFQWKHGSYLTLTVRPASAITSIVTSAAGPVFGWRSNPGPGPNAAQVSAAAAAAAECGPNGIMKPRRSLQGFSQLSHSAIRRKWSWSTALMPGLTD